MRILVVCHDLSSNALGRAYCLWLLARELGWTLEVAGPAQTGGLWPPLVGSPFSRQCTLLDRRSRQPLLRDSASRSDVLVALKVWPASMGAARRLASDLDKPLLVDIDDPEVETVMAHLGGSLRTSMAMRWNIRRYAPRPSRLLQLVEDAKQHAVTVSNPVLQEAYGGVIVPHVRLPRPPGRPHESQDIRVVFAGTNRHHKGLDVLRRAVESLEGRWCELVITDRPPHDAAPWERWTGPTSLEDGLRLVDDADVVVVPSLDEPPARGQLPVKLIDAMMAGRAILASDLPTIRWAAGDAAILVPPGSVGEIADALATLRTPDVREQLGSKAATRAQTMFTPSAVASTLASVLETLC